MGKNKDMITISVKTATYEDFLSVKSLLQQDPTFIRRLKENTNRSTASWDDVGRFFVKLLQLAKLRNIEESAIRHMEM